MKRCLLLLLCAAPVQAEMSVEQELALGREAARKVEAQVQLDRSPQLNARLRRVAQALVPVCGRSDIPYQFKIMQSEQFNAMALPGGFVYVTSKVVRDQSDGELAFVLGHELSHITNRHSVHQMEGDQMRRLGMLALLVGLGRGRVSSQAVSLAQVVDQVISSRYSQEDEDEADRQGLEMMSRAGYDPSWGLLTLQRMAKLHDGGMPQFVNAMVGTHPLPQERIDAALRFIPKIAYHPAASLLAQEDWKRDLTTAVAQGTGMRPDPALNEQAARELQAGQVHDRGTLMVSPAEEPFGVMERRFLSQEVSWLTLKQPQAKSFGLAVHTAPNGEKLVWMRVR